MPFMYAVYAGAHHRFPVSATFREAGIANFHLGMNLSIGLHLYDHLSVDARVYTSAPSFFSGVTDGFWWCPNR